MKAVSEDIIHKTDHVDTKAKCIHEPIEGIDLNGRPSIERCNVT